MYAPPQPLMQDRRAYYSENAANRSAVTAMTMPRASHVVGQHGAKHTAAGQKQRGIFGALRSTLAHPALRLVLLVGCLGVALPYVMASAPPTSSVAVAGTQPGPAPTLAPQATDAVAAVPAKKEPLAVLQNSFDPVLVERLDEGGIADTGQQATTGDAPGVTTEMLRIIAQMTPEQIDALTFLLLSQQDPKAAAAASAATDQAALADQAPWVGDWDTEQPDGAPAVADAAAAAQNTALSGWFVYEASADTALIKNVDDPMSAIQVSPGTVLGDFGYVTEVRIAKGAATVLLSNGDTIPSHVTAQIEYVAPDPVEPRRGPPFEIAVPSSTLILAEPPVTEGDATPDAEPDLQTASAQDAVPPPKPQAASADAKNTAAKPQTPFAPGRYVQVASFKSAKNAEVAKAMLTSDGMAGQLDSPGQNGTTYHRVIAGPFEPADIRTALTRVTRLGFKDAFIIR